MNYMKKSKNQSDETRRRTQQLARSIGDFIEYWGFRRIQGQLWTQIFLSEKPLSGADLAQRQKVSKALVSPALKQLLKYGLIFEVKAEDPRKKLYVANPNFLSVIKTILEKRELPLLQLIQNDFAKLEATAQQGLHGARLEELGRNIQQANLIMTIVSQMNSFEELEMLFQSPSQGGGR